MDPCSPAQPQAAPQRIPHADLPGRTPRRCPGESTQPATSEQPNGIRMSTCDQRYSSCTGRPPISNYSQVQCKNVTLKARLRGDYEFIKVRNVCVQTLGPDDTFNGAVGLRVHSATRRCRVGEMTPVWTDAA